MIWVALALAGDPKAELVAAHVDGPVGSVAFTFHVSRDGAVKAERTWAWDLRTGQVSRTVGGVTLSYDRDAIATEAERDADAQLVNDTFWLSPALHVSWAGDDLAVIDGGEVDGPLGIGAARAVTLQYAATGGGYTPGDAYDLYLRDGRIAAWSYRRGGGEPSLTTTFDAYVHAGPLWVATEHSDGAAFRLWLSDVSVQSASPAAVIP